MISTSNATAVPPGQPGHNQIYKIKPLLNSLEDRFVAIYALLQLINNFCCSKEVLCFDSLFLVSVSPMGLNFTSCVKLQLDTPKNSLCMLQNVQTIFLS